jgi:hypothetical protein
MAGPFRIDPMKSLGGIPTSGSGKQTKILVTNTTVTVGCIRMRAGSSAPEENEIFPGTIELDRNFGGAPLTVTNLGPVALTVSTQ